jgi:hypothetical protein
MWLTRPLLSLSAQIIKIGSVAALSERGALCFLSWCTAPNFCHDVAAKGFFRILRRAEAPPNQMRATRFPSVMLRKGKRASVSVSVSVSASALTSTLALQAFARVPSW